METVKIWAFPVLVLIALAAAILWFDRAPDPTVSQYVDTERGVACYTYGSSGISCVRDE